MSSISSFLNNITMYRLMMYYLIFMVICAIVLSVLQIIPFDPISIALSAFYLTLACRVINEILAKIFKVGTNIESSIITGLILSLIVGPVNMISPSWISDLLFLTAIAAFAMGSKYILAIRKKHIFNPAAFGVVAGALALNQGASWWVGLPQLVPFIILGGLLIIKKIRRWELVITYLLVFMVSQIIGGLGLGLSPGVILTSLYYPLLYSSLPFFIFVMLAEPLTSPPTKMLRIYFAIVVALVSLILQSLDIYYNLELSLLIGNIFATVASPQFRQVFKLKKKEEIAPGVVEFQFEPFTKFNYKAGQYLEWTLPHKKPDSRGVRRFFTISSSPTEDDVILTSKFYKKPSTFKQTLHKMESGDEIVISGLSGEFTLPENKDQKLVFIAGGIGVTPFRSMVQYMVDKGEKRDIILLFSNKTEEDIVFKDLFDNAKLFGVRTVYVNTDKDGFIDEKLIKKEVPDWKARIFYISGPEPMVEAFEKMLSAMGLSRNQIKRDYFPGYTETHQK